MSNTVPFVLGFDENGGIINVDLTKETHISIFGPAESGKTVLINNLILSLTGFNSPSEVSLIIMDVKNSANSRAFATLPHVLTYAFDSEAVIETIKSITNIIEQRRELLDSSNTADWDTFRSKLSKDALDNQDYSYIYAIFDEMTETLVHMKASNKEAHDALIQDITRIIQLARAVGIKLVSVAQKTTSDSVPKSVIINSSLKIAFMPDDRDYSVIGANKNNLTVITEPGHCIYSTGGMASASTAHTTPPYLRNEALFGHIKLSAEHWKFKRTPKSPLDNVIESDNDEFGSQWKNFIGS
jgi:DNA segregation ATPase FtsK/SpoIIIE-like protein